MNDSLFAIALYRPLEGKQQELLEIIETHTPLLAQKGLLTEFKPILLCSGNGTYIELFEWKSQEAKEKAHQSNDVRALWERMMKIVEMKELSSISEANQIFPNFKRIK